MKVNPQQLLQDGFIVLRQVIPPDRLDALRATFEVSRRSPESGMEARAQTRMTRPAEAWETSAQPRGVLQ